MNFEKIPECIRSLIAKEIISQCQEKYIINFTRDYDVLDLDDEAVIDNVDVDGRIYFEFQSHPSNRIIIKALDVYNINFKVFYLLTMIDLYFSNRIKSALFLYKDHICYEQSKLNIDYVPHSCCCNLVSTGLLMKVKKDSLTIYLLRNSYDEDEIILFEIKGQNIISELLLNLKKFILMRNEILDTYPDKFQVVI